MLIKNPARATANRNASAPTTSEAPEPALVWLHPYAAERSETRWRATLGPAQADRLCAFQERSERGPSSPAALWLASAALLRDSAAAFALFIRAWEQAVAANDPARAQLACVGAVDAVLCGGAPFSRLRGLLERLEGSRGGPTVQGRHNLYTPEDWHATLVAARALAAALMVQPDHPEVPKWRQHVEAQWQRLPEIAAGVSSACCLVLDLSRRGRLVRAGTLVRRLGAMTAGRSLDPATELCWCWARAAHASHTGALETAARAVDDATTVAERSGVRVLDLPLALEGIRAQLAAGRLDAAESACDRLLGAPNLPADLAGCVHQLASQVEGRKNRVLPALAHARAAVDLLADGPASDLALAKIGAAQLLLESGDRSGSHQMLVGARASARSLDSAWVDSLVALTSAEHAFAASRAQRGAHLLRRGLATARKHGLLHPPIWSSRLLARMCQRALVLGIEEPLVRAMIRANALVPESPSEVTRWPWPICVYTLGRFTLEVDGELVPAQRRREFKPFLLIKVLVALRRREVTSSILGGLLWPDADGNVQAANLRTTVCRARRLLGHVGAITVEHGAYRLAPQLVWTDVWACEDCLARAQTRLCQDGGLLSAADLCERALELYRGPFLPTLKHTRWSHGLRERLPRRLVTTACDVAERLAICGFRSRATRLIGCVLNENPTAESAYRLLMQLHVRHGRWTQAMETYARCESTLATLVGTTPSAELQAEHARLLRQLSGAGHTAAATRDGPGS